MIMLGRSSAGVLAIALGSGLAKVCLASNRTSIPEVGDDLVDYFDPTDEADALAKVAARGGGPAVRHPVAQKPASPLTAAARRLPAQEHIFETAPARPAINRKIAINGGYARDLQPLGQGYERGICEIGRQIGVFFQQINDPRQILHRSLIDCDAAVRPPKKIAPCVRGESQQKRCLGEHRDVGNQACRAQRTDKFNRSTMISVVPIKKSNQGTGINDDAWHAVSRSGWTCGCC
jgi:hypothetical protein